jgi:hypothetical protein
MENITGSYYFYEIASLGMELQVQPLTPDLDN